MRKTKIICTIGPSSSNEEILKQMCDAGMNVARINFSHGTDESHIETIEMVKKVREELDLPIAIMLDTKGPEYRIGTFQNGKIELKDGDKFTFTTKDIVGNKEKVSVSYKGLAEDLSVGDTILVNNGLVILEVKEIFDTEIECQVVTGGILSNKKSMSFPNKVLKQTFLSEQDKHDIKLGIEHGVDFIACSFVSNKENMMDVQNFLKENGGEHIGIIAKIENRAGVDNIDEIVKECHGVMIARGDLGVEIPFIEVPTIQKMLINKCRILGKRVITATEMLESMINNPRPTRAEISDVANAVYDGSSAVMLSGESAAGKYPIQAVQVMAQIAEETEKNIDYEKMYRKSDFIIKNQIDAISHSTCGIALDLKAKCIVVCSRSGATARMISRFRCPIDIIGLTIDKNAWYQLALSWGVIPIMSEKFESTDVLFYYAERAAKETLNLQEGDNIIVTGGKIDGKSGNTNIIKVEMI